MNDDDRSTALEEYRQTLIAYRIAVGKRLAGCNDDTLRLAGRLGELSVAAEVSSGTMRADIEQAYRDATAARLRRIRSR